MATIGKVGPGRLIVQIEKKERSDGGIYIPDSAQNQKPGEGVVTHVGPIDTSKEGVEVTPFCKVGDRILYPLYSGIPFKLTGDNHDYVCLSFGDVCATVEN